MLKKRHEAFRIDRSSCVHRSAFAHRSPFTYRSPNSVLRSHTVHSACVQRSFIVRSAFAHRSSGKVERFRDCISPLGRAWPFIWTNLNPLHPRILCAKFGWNWPNGFGEEDENVKNLQTDGQTDRQTDGQTDDGRQVIRKAHLSFQLRWAKNDCSDLHKKYNWL